MDQAVDYPKSGARLQHQNNYVNLLSLSKEQASDFGLRSTMARHRLAELELFTDSGLIDLLENYPRDRLQAFTMGTDPTQWNDWKPVDTAGASGKDLFAAVMKGRMWLNITGIHLVDSRFRDLIEELYGEICKACSHFNPYRKLGTLLISSPNALVYYHADAQPNILWQLRGSKRVWVYPASDRELVSQEQMEDIFASFADEEVPYRPEFDRKATVFDLAPGYFLAWPQNAPHRTTNMSELNVSLSTVHETRETDRRKLVYCANRLFTRSYGIPLRSTKETGVISWGKRFAFRGFRRAGLVKTPPRRAYITDLRVDLNSGTGIGSVINGPILTEFSQKDYSIKRDSAGQIVAVERPMG